MTQQEFFNRYTFNVRTDKIGGGGFGAVYKAYDNTLHREVAVKVSEVKTTSDGQKTFSLKDEFDALKGLPEHPNIANYEYLYSFEMPNGVFDYAVMQYYPDGSLSKAIQDGLTAEQKEEIATQLLDGLDFLHSHQVVHRDFKPGNVLIVKHGGKVIPLITDFGLSKSANAADGSVFSNSFGGGTARYSSPEQLQGKPLRFNTDLWSYGVVLYELFTGQPLFKAGSSAANSAQADLEIYNKIINGDVGERLGDMPEKWRKVLERCLVVDPKKRVQSAEELRALLSSENSVQEDHTVEEDRTFVEETKREHTEPVIPVQEKHSNLSAPAHNQYSAPDYSVTPYSSRKRLLWIIGGVAISLTIAVIIHLIVSNHNRKEYVNSEQAFIDSLHMFPPINFADSLYCRVVTLVYEDGSPKIVFYYMWDKYGKPTDDVVHETHYYENKQIFIDGNRKGDNRDGLWYAYFPDGTVQTKAYYEDGKENGRYTVYYSNGNVRYTGLYKYGVKIGKWYFYNENGTLSRVTTP